MASLYFRRGAWELRYREPSGKQRCERFAGGTTRRAPEEALDRHADGAFHERADSGPAEPDDEVAFPVPGHRSVLGLGGALAEHDLGGDVTARTLQGSGAWDP